MGAVTKRLSGVLARVLPRGAYLRLNTLAKLGYWPNVARPRTFVERMLQRSLAHGDDPILATTGSKVGLRDFVAARVGAEYLPQLVQVLGPGDRVHLESWPATAVMKASHASNWIRFVERDRADAAELDALVADWLGRSYASFRGERHYAKMARRVLVEEDLRQDGRTPDDYKVFVFGGRARMVVVDRDRFGGHARFLTDAEWHPLAVRYIYPTTASDVARPARWPEMVALAERLAEGFPFVRVDLYVVDERVLVGELTHFPDGGVSRFPRPFDVELGAVWGEGRAIDPRWRRAASRDMPGSVGAVE